MFETPEVHLPLPLDATPARLHQHLDVVWSLEEALLGSLEPETLAVAPDPLRHPLIFYYGHTAAFFINKLRAAGVLAMGIDDSLDVLLAKGVDPATPDELDALVWPSVDVVRAYRARVYERVHGIIERHTPRAVGPDDPLWSLWMALAHARIHFETSTVLVRQLPLRFVRRVPGWRYAETHGAPPPNRSLRVGAGVVELGRPAGVNYFGWDNEFGHELETVEPFEVTRNLVSNAEFLAFVRAGGYARDELWTPEGVRWRETSRARHPKFWREVAPGDYRYRAMFDELALPLDWPVEVNCHEAAAYCAYKGAGWRLPSEVEHLRLADAGDVVERGWNNALSLGSPAPVGRTGRRDGCSDVWGNVWQWLRDDFRPLPGFTPHRLYEDFSVPYFDSEHAAMIGGSWCSSGSTASRYYRLWFRRHFFQHAGFRMTRPAGS